MRLHVAAAIVFLAAGCTHTVSTTTHKPVTCEWGGGKLSGIVIDRAGKPVQNFELHIFGGDSDLVVPVKTDADGRFDFGCVGAARFHIGADINWWGRMSYPLTVHRGEEIRVKIVLRTKRRVSG